eukprot:2540037-Rhodomonas_salina.4
MGISCYDGYNSNSCGTARGYQPLTGMGHLTQRLDHRTAGSQGIRVRLKELLSLVWRGAEQASLCSLAVASSARPYELSSLWDHGQRQQTAAAERPTPRTVTHFQAAENSCAPRMVHRNFVAGVVRCQGQGLASSRGIEGQE